MKDHVIRILLIMLTFTTAGCAVTERYDQYLGKVVDAETKQPLEGAAVVVVYNTQHWGLAGSVTYYADAQETVTDKNGEFRIPSIRLYTLQILSGWEQHPRVTILKPGYGCYPTHKYAAPKFEYGSLPPNQYVTIELPKLITKEERLQNYGCYPSESVPEVKYEKLFHLIQQEREDIGLDPSRSPQRSAK